jgi:hypothetical protein
MSRTREIAVGDTSQTIRLLQVGTALSLLVMLWQFVSAGQIMSGADATGRHGAGAIALHLVTGLTLAATVLHARRSGTWWPVGLAAVVFVLTFIQAGLGSSGTVAVHVPLALGITAGVVWLTAWAFLPATPA